MRWIVKDGKLWWVGADAQGNSIIRRVYRAHDGSRWVYINGRKQCVRAADGPIVPSL